MANAARALPGAAHGIVLAGDTLAPFVQETLAVLHNVARVTIAFAINVGTLRVVLADSILAQTCKRHTACQKTKFDAL